MRKNLAAIQKSHVYGFPPVARRLGSQEAGKLGGWEARRLGS
jgi:hypothetical protein